MDTTTPITKPALNYNGVFAKCKEVKVSVQQKKAKCLKNVPQCVSSLFQGNTVFKNQVLSLFYAAYTSVGKKRGQKQTNKGSTVNQI